MKWWVVVLLLVTDLTQFNMNFVFASEIIPLKLIVNTVDKGELFSLLDDQQKIYIAADDYSLLGMKNPLSSTQTIEDRDYISLNEVPGIKKFHIDEKNLSLLVDVDPSFLDKTRLDLTQQAQVQTDLFGIDSAFLKYAWIQRGTSSSHEKAMEIPLEAVISVHDVLLQTAFTYRQDNNIKHWTRGISSLTKDYPTNLSRLVLGDFAARSGELGGSGLFAGLSYSKYYSMATHFTKYPSLNVSGLLNTPSRVNMYINDVIVRSEKLPAGEYEIDNLPNLFGAGDLEVEIIDAFGRSQRQTVPYYISTRLLRRGLHDYSYNFGFKRDSLIVPEPKYDVYPSFLGFHRYGVSRRLTAGARFEFTKSLINTGAMFNYLLESAGEIEIGAAYSEVDTQSGYAGYFRYGFTSNYFHGRYSIRQNSEGYTNISNLQNLLSLQSSQAFTLGTHGLSMGSLSVNYSITKSFINPEFESYSVVYGRRIAGQVSLLLRAVKTVDEQAGASNSVFISLNSSIGKRSSINTSYTELEEAKVSSVNLQRSAPVGTGLGYRLKQDYVQDELTGTSNISDISLLAKTRHFSGAADYFVHDDLESYQMQVSGSLSYIDDSFYLTRPIQDSFGLVKIGELDDVRVYYSSELIGRTRQGKLLLPNLISYADNQIAIEPKDVPVDQNLKKTKLLLSPKHRSGSVAQFKIEKFQGFSGFVFFRRGTQKQSADFAAIILKKQDQSMESVVGRGGEFYFENLESGEYQVTIHLDKTSCEFSMQVPRSNDMMVELGEYECRI